jgi:hypothetical protein
VDINIETEALAHVTATATKPEDPFAALEVKISDERVANEQKKRLKDLHDRNARTSGDVYRTSTRVRKVFRERRKEIQHAKSETAKLQDKHSLDLPLVPATKEDSLTAESITYARNPPQMSIAALVKEASDPFSSSFEGISTTQKPFIRITKRKPLVSYDSDTD